MDNIKKPFNEYILGWWARVEDSNGKYSMEEAISIKFNCEVDTIISYDKNSFTVYTPKGNYSILEGYLTGCTKDDWISGHEEKCVHIRTLYLAANVICGNWCDNGLDWRFYLMGDKLLESREDYWILYQRVKGFK